MEYACVVGMATGATLAVAGAPLVLSAAGFTSAGVAAGSWAAYIQTVFYAGQTGGGFAIATSAGAAGFSAAGNAVLGAGGAVVGKYFSCGA